MSWVQFVPPKKEAKVSRGLPVIKMVRAAYGAAVGLVSATAREAMGWESGLTFDLWLDTDNQRIGITVYAATNPKQGGYVCGHRGAYELTQALRSLGLEAGAVLPVSLNEDKQADVITWVARQVKK